MAGATSQAATTRSPGPRILLLTPYTGGNLGDGAIQEAVIHHIQKRMPTASIQLISISPRTTERLHGIRTFPLTRDPIEAKGHNPFEEAAGANAEIDVPTGVVARAKRFLRRYPFPYSFVSLAWRFGRGAMSLVALIPKELRHWYGAAHLLKQADVLVMSGGGQINAYWGGTFGQPYALFKWTLLARRTGKRVIFLSVGVGSLQSPVSRFFAVRALQAADYRSYRDPGSKALLQHAAFAQDAVLPDLAFSHPRGQPSASLDSRAKVVGVSPIAYLAPRTWPQHDAAVYDKYMAELVAFTRHLTISGYEVVLFVSALMDVRSLMELRRTLSHNHANINAIGRVRLCRATSASELLDAITGMDLVVASRLHGIILSHILGKPVMAISYDRKVRAHMEDMKQADYCLELRGCSAAAMIDAFNSLVVQAPQTAADVGRRVAEKRGQLNRQYDRIVNLLGADHVAVQTWS